MDATRVDWSMGSQAAKLADWDTAIDIGRRVAGPGPSVEPADRARMREDMAALVAEAESLVTGFTGLELEGFRTRAWVMGRGDWIRQNLTGLQRILEPLAERVLAKRPDRPTISRKALGAQAGALLGYVSRRVIGQYDVFLPPDDEGLLYFVGPNVVEVERRFGLSPRDFRLWISIHEVTHRVQFSAAPWLRTQLSDLVDSYLGSVQLDSKQLIEQVHRVVDELRSSRDTRASGLMLILTPEQRAIVERTQAMMSVLEGHASYVMNEVARDHVQDVERMRRVLAARRKTGGFERSLQRAIGFDKKVAQYDTGERFVREVVDRAGMRSLNLVWSAADALPSNAEIADPAAWLARVGG
jgi:coenzyme F420 biosynthesis associated uncharacterized protein